MNKNIFQWVILSGALLFTCCRKPDFTTPPTAGAPGTINQYLNNNFDFSLFAAAVQKIGFADTLDAQTLSFTVFAPTNEALSKEGVYAPSDFDSWTKDSLTQFVKIHILPGKIFFDSIPTTPDTRYTDLAGFSLYVSSTGYVMDVNGVNVDPVGSLAVYSQATYGYTELNGNVFPLDNTIKVSPESVAGFLSGRPDFTCLIAGLKKFGYWQQLQGQGPFTVLAPPDSVFIKRGLTVDSINRMDVSQVDPVIFACYFLTPNHVYMSDIHNLLPPSGVYTSNFPSQDPKYDIIIGQGPVFNGAGAVTAASANGSSQITVGPNASQPYEEQGAPFKGETLPTLFPVGTYINYTFSNGVVHLLDDIMVMPGLVQK